jgi:hypothetical protein
MKNLILLLTLTLTLSCCNKDDNHFSSKDQLPPETQTGANTVGCLVNGVVFLPKQSGLNSALECNYELINGKFYFNLRFSDYVNGIKTVAVQTHDLNLQINQTYSLNVDTFTDPNILGGGGIYSISTLNHFSTNTIKTGELKITRLDLPNSIISGTFWFDAFNNSTNQSVEIRQGRFDMHY